MVYQNSERCFSSTTLLKDVSRRHQKIVMLTDIIENDESKCAIYFPQHEGNSLYFINNSIIQPRDEKHFLSELERFYSKDENWHTKAGLPTNGKHFNYFCVRNSGICFKNGYSIRKLHCLYKSFTETDTLHEMDNTTEKASMPAKGKQTLHSEMKHFFVYHYWFQHWPDHRSPENIDVVLDMCLDVLDSNCAEYFRCDNKSTPAVIEERISPRGKQKERHMKSFENSYNKIADNISVLEPLHIIHW